MINYKPPNNPPSPLPRLDSCRGKGREREERYPAIRELINVRGKYKERQENLEGQKEKRKRDDKKWDGEEKQKKKKK